MRFDIKKILPHGIALFIFALATIFFFNPIFFDNKSLNQHDIHQYIGGSKSLADFRKATGEEGLWATGMFSGMPAYLVSVQWSNQPVSFLKRALTLSMPNGIANIFLALVGFYVLLLSFGVRPWLAIGGALAFGFSSYLVIGLVAGHNARIGAIACVPFVVAGIHLLFQQKKWTGFLFTLLGMALHLRENHLQITYYLLLIVLLYGIFYLVHERKNIVWKNFINTVALVTVAVCISVGSFFGQLWSIADYGKYSIRGKSEILPVKNKNAEGLSKEYAFEYSNGIAEPLSLIVPNIYGGASSHYFVQDKNSKTYQALVSSNDSDMANQLASYSSAYWGPQPLTAPYYAGVIVFFFFVLGVLVVKKQYVQWLVAVALLGVVISWGDHASFINNFFFDYLPGFNKFRSVTFAMLLPIFSIILLGMMGIETWMQKNEPKILWRAVFITLGLLLVVWVVQGMGHLSKSEEHQLPSWFLQALEKDRYSELQGDIFRGFGFVLATALLLWGVKYVTLSWSTVSWMITGLIALDTFTVSTRFISNDNYESARQSSFTQATAADEKIKEDTSYYRVLNLQSPFNEARTSYHHASIGGYHGAKLRRYQDLYDSAISKNIQQLVTDAQTGDLKFSQYNTLNMLNAKYWKYGDDVQQVITNPSACGAAWFVQKMQAVSSPIEELQVTKKINPREEAVYDKSKFSFAPVVYDSTATVQLISHTPKKLIYRYRAASTGVLVFSEIFYPGWFAYLDDKEIPVQRVDYVLRALSVPAGEHQITFEFKPKPYVQGNRITQLFSWLVLLCALGCVVMVVRKG